LKLRTLFLSLTALALFGLGGPALFGQTKNAGPKPKTQVQPKNQPQTQVQPKNQPQTQVQPKTQPQAQPQIQPKAQPKAQSPTPSPQPPGLTPNANSNPKVQFTTSLGAFTVELNPQAAPKTVENFLEYVKSGFYKKTIFHRVISTFMVQGGGHTADGAEKKTNPPVVNEAKLALETGLSNVRGAIAMARTPDPHSATSQFFINVVDNTRLDYTSDDSPGYCVFGHVTEGMDTIDKIRNVKTRPGDWPLDPVIITDTKILEARPARIVPAKSAVERPALKNIAK